MFDPTLNGVMAQIEAGKIVLPAMQRPFVWKDDRITKLLDSMYRSCSDVLERNLHATVEK